MLSMIIDETEGESSDTGGSTRHHSDNVIRTTQTQELLSLRSSIDRNMGRSNGASTADTGGVEMQEVKTDNKIIYLPNVDSLVIDRVTDV